MDSSGVVCNEYCYGYFSLSSCRRSLCCTRPHLPMQMASTRKSNPLLISGVKSLLSSWHYHISISVAQVPGTPAKSDQWVGLSEMISWSSTGRKPTSACDTPTSQTPDLSPGASCCPAWSHRGSHCPQVAQEPDPGPTNLHSHAWIRPAAVSIGVPQYTTKNKHRPNPCCSVYQRGGAD